MLMGFEDYFGNSIGQDVSLIFQRDALNSILRPFSTGSHFDELRIETRQDIDEIGLCSHDCIDVLIGKGHFIKARRDQRDSPFFQEGIGILPGKSFIGPLPAHRPTSTVGCRIQRLSIAFATYKEAGCCHRTGNDSKHTLSGRSRPLSVDDYLFAKVSFFPCIVG